MTREKTGQRWFNCNIFIVLSILMVVPSICWSAEDKYPSKPINMIVGFAPGGALDLGSAAVADKISEVLGQPIVSTYKPGAAGALGASFVARAKPDGYTIAASAPNIHTIATLLQKADWKFHDLVPVGLYGRIPYLFIVKADAPWKTLNDFIGDAKKSSVPLKVGFLGKLTNGDFITLRLGQYSGISLTKIPFKSSTEILTALLGGHIEGALTTGAGGLLESGTIRALAVAEEKRIETLPNVPTFKESGYQIAFPNWNSLFFPKDTPKEIFQKFCKAQETATARYSAELKKKLASAEICADFRTQEETMEQYKKEYDFYYKLYNEFGLLAK